MYRNHLLLHVFMILCLLIMLATAATFVDSPLAHAASKKPQATQAGAGLQPFIDTWDDIHVYQAFDYNIADPTSVAAQYDFVWGASLYQVAAWRQGNPAIFLTYYIPFDRDFGTFMDNRALHTLAWWQAYHPDWILYRCDKKTPAYFGSDPGVSLDFSNRAVIAWQMQTYAQPASQAGYNGIAADNVDLGNWAGACGVYRKGTWVQLYNGQRLDDPAWQANVLFWLSQVQPALHALTPPLSLIPNSSFADVPVTSALVQKMMAYVDGLAEEDGFTRQGHGYLTDTAWLQHMSFIPSLQAQGKAYYSGNQFPSVGPQEIQWALASYLMCKEHAAALAISGIQQYGGINWYPEYAAQIGSPNGDMYQDQQVYWRSYTNGLTIVNPSSTYSYTITLPSGVNYVDLYGNSVGSAISMGIHTGIVLLIAPAGSGGQAPPIM